MGTPEVCEQKDSDTGGPASPPKAVEAQSATTSAKYRQDQFVADDGAPDHQEPTKILRTMNAC